MKTHVNERALSAMSIYVKTASLTAIMLGMAVLLGWIFEIALLKSLLPGLATMKPLTALGILLAGSALWLLQNEAQLKWPQRLRLTLAGLVAVIGGIILVEYIFNLQPGIDQWLFARAVQAEGGLNPGRPSPTTALCLFLLGLALLNIDGKAKALLPTLTIPILLIGLLALLGYAYGVSSLYQVGLYNPMALHTAVILILLAFGALAARPEHPLTTMLTSSLAGGVMVRREVMAAILIPFITGWLRLQGELLGWYDGRFGLALFATSNIVVFVSLIFWSARQLNTTDLQRESAFASLRKSESQLAGMIGTALDAIITIDADQNITLFNAAAEKMFGYSTEVMLGQSLNRLLPERYRSIHAEHIRRFGEVGVTTRAIGFSQALSGVRANGEEFPIEASISKIEVEGRKFYTVILRDITARKQSEENIAYQAQLLAHVTDAIVASDKQYQLTAWNAAAESLYGWQADEVLGRKGVEILQTEFPNVDAEEMRSRIAETGSWRGEATQLRKDGMRIPVEISSIVLRDAEGQINGYLSVNRDIAERKRAEQQINQLNATLEKRVIERTAELEREIGERKQAETELQSALVKTRTLYDVAQTAISASASLPAMLQKLVGYVAESLPADRATLIVFDRQAQAVNHIVRGGPGAEQVALAVSFSELMDGLTGWAIREGKSALSPKAMPDPRESDAVQRRRVETNCGAVLVTPLLYQKEILGTITVINLPEDPDFTGQDALFLETIANQAATAIISTRLYESLQHANRNLADRAAELEKEVAERAQAEGSLARERDLLQALMDNIPDMIYFKDTDSRFTRINRAQAKILGVKDPQDASGKTDLDFQGKELSEEFYQEEQRIIETGEPLIDRVEYNPTTEGKPRWLSATKMPLRNKEGIIEGMVGISRDITERKRMEEALQSSNEQLRHSFEEVERRNREILLLSEVTNLLESSETIQDAYEILQRYLPRLFPTEAGGLYITSASRKILETVVLWGEFTIASEENFQPPDCWALRRGKAHVVHSVSGDVLCKHITHKAQSDLAPYMCIPLMAHGEAMGVFHLQCDPNDAEGITPARELLANTAAEQFSLSFANIILRETLRSQSIRDPLTGLFNRRYMEESLDREIKRAERNGSHLGVVMLDLDHFKKFNDTFGHAAGDVALREFGKLLLGKLRGSDIACRYGGEEFTLILTEVDPQSILGRLETLREAVKQMVIEFHGSTLGSFTVSVGLSYFPAQGNSAEALLKAADDALYQSKHAGRDRVTLSASLQA